MPGVEPELAAAVRVGTAVDAGAAAVVRRTVTELGVVVVLVVAFAAAAVVAERVVGRARV